MTVVIASTALSAIRTHVASTPDEEACGLLLGSASRIDEAIAAANVAEDRRRRFEIDPALLLARHRAARQGGAALVGCYHSHPGGRATPSLRDAAAAHQPGWLWIIVAGDAMGVFRACAGGVLAGRFDPVEWEVV